mgnify:CR=1 FL=1
MQKGLRREPLSGIREECSLGALSGPSSGKCEKGEKVEKEKIRTGNHSRASLDLLRSSSSSALPNVGALLFSYPSVSPCVVMFLLDALASNLPRSFSPWMLPKRCSVLL